MSLNLLSSLSYLKSRLGTSVAPGGGGKGGPTAPPPARLELYGGLKAGRGSLDLYGGMTESDLESSSSESEEEEPSDIDTSR